MIHKKKKRRLLILVLLLSFIFGSLTFFGEKGILHILRLKRELTRIKEANTKIEEENQKLREEVRRLHERSYIEEIARKELGMVKEGEIIYLFDLPPHEKENPK